MGISAEMTALLPRRFSPTRICALLIFLYALIFLLFPNTYYGFWGENWPSIVNTNLRGDVYANIWNETLGFEHIYAIGLKERTDKRDFLTLAASEMGFKVEWVDGVRPEDLDPSSLPIGFNLTTHKGTVIACWRAHMNVLNKVIENDYSTTLILEDDADWDVSIHHQLRGFARSVRELNNENHAPKQAPYGTDWDILWIGGCASGPAGNETTFVAIPDDPTLPNPDFRSGWGGPLDAWKKGYPELPMNTTRFIYRANMGCCTYGYVVSAQGARRILAALSADHINCPVDNSMSDLCAGTNGYDNRLRCYAPWPNFIGTFKNSGPAARDSDIEGGNPNEWHESASAWNVVYSTRLNLHRLVTGEETVRSQHKNKLSGDFTELRLDEIHYPEGILIRP